MSHRPLLHCFYAILETALQVAIGQQFGVNNIDQWQDSCMLNAAPGILICTSPEHDVITWEVNDGNAHHQHRLVKDAVLEQCRCHISSVHFVVDEAVPDEAFQRVAHLSSDGDDTGFQHIYQDMRTRVVRISRNQQEEEPGRHASGPLQKHPPSEHGISADPNTMVCFLSRRHWRFRQKFLSSLAFFRSHCLSI